jgi:exonuclease SbcD
MKKPIATFLTDTHLKEGNLVLNHSIYKQAIDIAKNLGLKRIFHLGDIFDSRQSQTIELLKNGFFDILEVFKNEDIKLLAIAGNHDRTDYSSKHSFLTTFQYHPSFILYEDAGCIQLTNDIELYLLPFFEDSVYNQYLQSIFGEGSLTARKVLGTHIGFSGAIMNNGTVVHSSVDKSFISRFEKVLVGHYHDQQEFDNIHYIGASMQHNFGEKSNKGLTVLYDDLSTELIPLDFPKFTTLYISVKDLKNQDIEDLKKEKEETSDNFRVILEGSNEETSAFNKQELLSIGIKVEKKQNKVVKEEIETRVEKYDKTKLSSYFTEFCNSNLLVEEEGFYYLNQI